MRWRNGDSYAGVWANDQRHGEGTNTWANGESYTGGWQADLKHGSPERKSPRHPSASAVSAPCFVPFAAVVVGACTVLVQYPASYS